MRQWAPGLLEALGSLLSFHWDLILCTQLFLWVTEPKPSWLTHRASGAPGCAALLSGRWSASFSAWGLWTVTPNRCWGVKRRGWGHTPKCDVTHRQHGGPWGAAPPRWAPLGARTAGAAWLRAGRDRGTTRCPDLLKVQRHVTSLSSFTHGPCMRISHCASAEWRHSTHLCAETRASLFAACCSQPPGIPWLKLAQLVLRRTAFWEQGKSSCFNWCYIEQCWSGEGSFPRPSFPHFSLHVEDPKGIF